MPDAKPEPTRIPTEEELTRLPRRAVVAFAARCARRVLSLFGRAEGIADFERHRAAVSRAIVAAEAFAAGIGSGAAAARAAYVVTYAVRATARASDAAAHAAARAACSATHAADTASCNGDPASYAADAASYAAYAVSPAAIWDDYALLREKVTGDDPPIPPAFFGLPLPAFADRPGEGDGAEAAPTGSSSGGR